MFYVDFWQDSSSSHPSNSICDTDDQHKFKDLTLADLKVMGIVGKVFMSGRALIIFPTH